MIKNYLKFSALILSGILAVSCGKDDEETNNTNEPEFPTEYSDLTVEQNKANLEDNGISLVKSVTSLKNTSGIQTSIAFSKHLDGSTLPDNLSNGRVSNTQGVNLLTILASLGNDKTSVADALSNMRVEAGDFTSFQEEYESLLGIYTYSKANDTWTYTQTGSKIVFRFPSTENGTTNNAEYSVYDYKGTQITSNIGGDSYTGDYPTALKADLTIDGTKKMEYSFSAAYDSNGEPTNVSTSITIDNYKFSYDVENTTTKASVDYGLTQDGKNLFAFGARATGNFNSGNIENSGGPEDVFETGSAYFQILNIKFSGEVNTPELVKALDAAKTKAEQAAAWNANYKLIVFYADSKKKIADSEFYVTTESITYPDYGSDQCKFDQWGYPYDCPDVTETRENLEVRIVFADNTKSDLATYTETGFEDIQDELSAFIEDLGND
ncbi:MAG TPA: hypothetical protein VIN08_20730 [Ohtaekwangia sp.]|uniref:hypothetical protein n=1 Tax=Ohtaekwangia sp. TaxID=2066019 RepID=UPI002F950880